MVGNNNGVTVRDVPVTEYPRPCKTAVGSRNWLKLAFLESENCGAHQHGMVGGVSGFNTSGVPSSSHGRAAIDIMINN